MGKRFFLLFTGFFTVFWLTSCSDQSGDLQDGQAEGKEKKIIACVSIVPQADFVERIGGENIEVHIMVPPGHSPATYEPAPKQMSILEKADVYFRIGVPFEQSWMDRIRQINPQMKIVDTGEGIKLRDISENTEKLADTEVSDHDHEHARRHEGKDPHIWLAPPLVKTQARHIADGLTGLDEGNSAFYEENLKDFHKKLDELDDYIKQRLKNLKERTLYVFHPSWGYFADTYGLKQVAIEHEGKKPGAKKLGELIDSARQTKINAIFVQKEFSQTVADAVAEAVDAEIVTLDPLAPDYLKNMREMADIIADEVNK